MNKLIMNYFIIEGFKDAAEKFQQESGTTRKQCCVNNENSGGGSQHDI